MSSVVRYWSRVPGKFVNKLTGADIFLSSTLSPGPTFCGKVSDWYESLVSVMVDAAEASGMPQSFDVRVSRDVLTILETTCGYRPMLGVTDALRGTLASKRINVFCDALPRNEVIVSCTGTFAPLAARVIVLDMSAC